jgi:competence protein ComEA
MKFSKSWVAAIFIGALVGSSPVWVHSADTTKKPTDSKKPAARSDRVDINTASVNQLKALEGLNEAQAKKIVDGRPYKKRSELLSKKILPQETYDKVKSHISTRAPATKG